MSRFSDLPSLSVRRPTLVVVMNLLIIIAGLAAIMGVEVRELPDVDRPVVTVRAFFDGASPETMDAEVTSVLEGAVARVSGVKRIEAASEENNCRVRAEFSPDMDLDVAANDCADCPPGQHQDQTGQTSCLGTACAAGHLRATVSARAHYRASARRPPSTARARSRLGPPSRRRSPPRRRWKRRRRRRRRTARRSPSPSRRRRLRPRSWRWSVRRSERA